MAPELLKGCDLQNEGSKDPLSKLSTTYSEPK
jgi:hypothetical protein